MLSRRMLSILFSASSLTAAVFTLARADAAPNYYSRGGGSDREAQLRVVEPKAGTYAAGEKILISWRKSVGDKEVEVSVHEAAASGARSKKIADVDASASARDRWTRKGGAVYWTVPESLPKGRYIVQVRAGTFLAGSDPFAVSAPKGPQLGPEKIEAPGVVKHADVKDKGARGHVVIKAGDKETTYDFGDGACPALGGGLPGALAMMASVGDAEIQPRVRELVSKDGAVTQRCIVGLIAKNRPAPEGD